MKIMETDKSELITAQLSVVELKNISENKTPEIQEPRCVICHKMAKLVMGALGVLGGLNSTRHENYIPQMPERKIAEVGRVPVVNEEVADSLMSKKTRMIQNMAKSSSMKVMSEDELKEQIKHQQILNEISENSNIYKEMVERIDELELCLNQIENQHMIASYEIRRNLENMIASDISHMKKCENKRTISRLGHENTPEEILKQISIAKESLMRLSVIQSGLDDKLEYAKINHHQSLRNKSKINRYIDSYSEKNLSKSTLFEDDKAKVTKYLYYQKYIENLELTIQCQQEILNSISESDYEMLASVDKKVNYLELGRIKNPVRNARISLRRFLEEI